MYRTTNEALGDFNSWDAIPYEAPHPWGKPLTDEQFHALEDKEICPTCLGKRVPFEGSFFMGAGHGCRFIVSYDSGLCFDCFNELNKNRPEYKVDPCVKTNYAFGSASLQTTSFMEEGEI